MNEPAHPGRRLLGSVLVAAMGLVCVCLARELAIDEGGSEGRYGLMSIGVLLVLVGPWIPLEWRMHLDFERGEVVRAIYYGPGLLRRRTTSFAEFGWVTVRRSRHGLGGGEVHHTSDVGLVPRDGGRIFWLKSYVCTGRVPAPEAMALARQIRAATGLPGGDCEHP